MPAIDRFRVNIGLNYGDVRREPGEIADDIPVQSRKWLLEQGHITLVRDAPPEEVKRDAARQ